MEALKLSKKVCILLTNYNHMNYIENCIKSLRNQTYDNYDIYIIDDCSIDGSYEYLKEISSNNIFVFKNDENLGFISSLNKAKKIIPNKYDYVYRVDSDDEYSLDSISVLVSHAEKYSLDVVGSYIETFGSTQRKYKFPLKHNDIVKALCIGSPVTHSGVLIRTSYYRDIEYNKEYIHCEDYKLWIDLYSKGAVFGNVDHFLLKYRKHDCNATKNSISNDTIGLVNKIRKQHINNTTNNSIHLELVSMLNDNSRFDVNIFISFFNYFLNDASNELKLFIGEFLLSYLRRSGYNLSLLDKIKVIKLMKSSNIKIDYLYLSTIFIVILNIKPESLLYIKMKKFYGCLNVSNKKG